MDLKLVKLTKVLLSNSNKFPLNFRISQRSAFSSRSLPSLQAIRMNPQNQHQHQYYRYHTSKSKLPINAAKAVVAVVTTGGVANEKESSPPVNFNHSLLLRANQNNNTTVEDDYHHGLRHDSRIRSYRHTRSRSASDNQLILNLGTTADDNNNNSAIQISSKNGQSHTNYHNYHKKELELSEVQRRQSSQPSIWSREDRLWRCFRTDNGLYSYLHYIQSVARSIHTEVCSLKDVSCGKNEGVNNHSDELSKLNGHLADEIHNCSLVDPLDSTWTLPSYICDDEPDTKDCNGNTKVAHIDPSTPNYTVQVHSMLRKFEKAEQERKLNSVNFCLIGFDDDLTDIMPLSFLEGSDKENGQFGVYSLW